MGSLLPFLPYQIAAELLRQPAVAPQTQAQRLQAVVLFADVSGFTPMSEALARLGNAGTEELTELLNDYFEVMIDLVASYGGMVAAFGGDALTALFLDDLPDAAARAIQCALDMQLLMQPYEQIPTGAGTFSLAIRVGIAAGSVLSAVVGEPTVRLQSVLVGQAVERAAAAEQQANIGEVVIAAELALSLPALQRGEQRGDFLVAAGLDARPAYAPLAPLPAPPTALLPTLSAFVHPAIARRVLEDRAGFVNEHRSVSVLFVGFDGFDYNADPSVHPRLQAYVAEVTRVVQRYNGNLNKFDFDNKGSKLVVVFGAPVAHEDDTERAMHCALVLRELSLQRSSITDGAMPEPPFSVCVGIASGLVFCGLVGAELRREYTVMGDTVNLAARLMQAAAPGEIVVASGTHRRVAERFHWQPLAPLPLKGRSRIVTVYRLEEARQRAVRHQEPAYKVPMVGRDAEMQLIEQRMDLALRGQGQVLGISAEAGMGKSRLVAEVMRLASRRGMEVLSGECISHGGSSSYLPWHSVLRGLFRLDPAWNAETQLRQCIAAIDVRLLARLPLLAMALNLPLEETDLTRSLDARVRKDVLETTLLECVRALTSTKEAATNRSVGAPAFSSPGASSQHLPACLLVIEDCHWIDSLSHDLLEVVARGVADRPVLLLLAYRPPEREHDRLRVTRLPHFSELHLREFSLRETEWLIGLKFGYLFGARGVLPASFIERITVRSQGNPFYIDQMINFIQDQGISPADGEALERVRLPDSLRALIISRIDRLPEQEQITLKVASVIGRAFQASWLWGIYPQLGLPDQVRANLDTLSRLDLTAMEKSEPELEYLFKHVVTQEVAYESLAVATRSMLHELVARFIEQHFASDSERYLDLLAYHYGRSDNLPKQRHYFQRAGEAAQAAYANLSALDYYRRLRRLLEPAAQIGVLLREGEVLQLIGRWQEAEAGVRQALALAEAANTPSVIARAKTALAHLLAARGDYDAAITIIDEVMPIWERLDDPTGQYDALWVLGYVLIDIGEYTRGLRQLEHTHEIAVRLGDQRLIAGSIGSMGLVYIDIYDYEMALYCLERGAAMAQRFSDWSLLARTRSNVGFVLMNQQQLVEALALFHELFQRAAEIGDRVFIAKLSRQIGRCHQLGGELPQALRCYALQVAMGLELGERRDLAIGLGYVAETYAQQGDEIRAERVYELALALCESIRLVYWSCEFRHGLALLHTSQGRYAEAAALNRMALQTAQERGSHRAVQLGATLLAARLQLLLGQQGPAEAAAALAELDEDWYDLPQRAAISYTIWQIDPVRANNRAAALSHYAALVSSRPTAESVARYAELAGEPTPALAPLPALPALIAQRHDELVPLIEQAEALLATPA